MAVIHKIDAIAAIESGHSFSNYDIGRGLAGTITYQV
jgi:hypothetical protein